MSFINEFLVRKKESIKLSKMVIMVCPDDRFWCSKEHSKLCFECLITVFCASKQLALAEGWKKLPKSVFL
jgi:hypothetical protein